VALGGSRRGRHRNSLGQDAARGGGAGITCWPESVRLMVKSSWSRLPNWNIDQARR